MADTRPRGIFLLPNLMTTASLFSGFYAIVASMRGEFDHAAIAIFIAMLMDGLDGRIARLTNTSSAFGAEYDSLADVISFGITPALVAYNWGLVSLGRFGWMAAFLYTVATALRLARFNSAHGTEDKRFFVGLPSTASAGFIASTVWVAYDYGYPGHHLWLLAAWAVVVASLLMVSPVLYNSFKGFAFKEKVPFMTLLLAILVGLLICVDPPLILFAIFSTYLASGPMMMLKVHWSRRRSAPVLD